MQCPDCGRTLDNQTIKSAGRARSDGTLELVCAICGGRSRHAGDDAADTVAGRMLMAVRRAIRQQEKADRRGDLPA